MNPLRHTDSRLLHKTLLLLLTCCCYVQGILAQAPSNDACENAIEISVPGNGFGLGNLVSPQANLTSATVQAGETFTPAVFVAGLDKKSVWYKFRLATIRAVRVTLSQPGTAITAGDAGFAVYRSDSCLPGNSDISTKLTPIVTFGNTYHPCVPDGEYYIQVSAKAAANGPIVIQVNISDQTGAPYDHPDQAYPFGAAENFSRYIDFDTECQSIESISEACDAFSDAAGYNKSAWFTFTTPAYFDYLMVTLSGTGTPAYFTSSGSLHHFGYTLYKGDARTSSLPALQQLTGCDSLSTDGYTAASRAYTCSDLERNTVYSIQLFFQKDFKNTLRLGLITGGIRATAAPVPVNTMAASNQLGILNASPAGVQTRVSDAWGCNSRHAVTKCTPAIPDSGVLYKNRYYNLGSFVSFTLDAAAAINFRVYNPQCGSYGLVRLFRQSLTADCSGLDTTNVVGMAGYNEQIDCLPPGDYVAQVLGIASPYDSSRVYYYSPARNYEQCFFGQLGAQFNFDMIAYSRKGSNRFSLAQRGAYDTIHRVGGLQLPLESGVTYQSQADTIGCVSTLRPADTTCSPFNDKIIYRQLLVADSGTVAFSNLVYDNSPPFRYKLYSGDAGALAGAANIFNFPDRINGLKPVTQCMDGYTYCTNKSACVVPGTYTFAAMAATAHVGKADRPSFTFTRTRTLHRSLETAQNMGSIMDTLGPSGGTIKSDADFWSCEDNAIPINGYVPCAFQGRPATKAIYRQFFLEEDAIIRIANTSYSGCNDFAYGTKTLFYGKATDGMAALSPVGRQWDCFSSAAVDNGCTFLKAGWYTVVSYGTGPSYDSTMRLVNEGGRYNSHVGYKDEFNITVTPTCAGPAFNRPFRASVAAGGQPHLFTWANRSQGTAAYPRTDTTYTLPEEHFNCTLDTPFAARPIPACVAGANRVAYYVFRITQVSFVQVNTNGYNASVFDRDVRTDSAAFATRTPLQACNNRAGTIQLCKLQPGTYTLVIYATDANSCSGIAPTVFIDRVDHARFDFASKAYDFTAIPPDNKYHNGKPGDVNPLHNGRSPSNDFFYCTTGAASTDPAELSCDALYDPNIYKAGNNIAVYDSAFPPGGAIPTRNLWYTFVAAHPGTVKIRVDAKTQGRNLQPRFAVYRSDVDGSLPFGTVVARGEVDSTLAQGLAFVTMNYIGSYNCYNAGNEISFYRDPCSAVATRYYVLVENVNAAAAEPGGQLPNTQVEVAVLLDSINLVLPKYDHYTQAADIGQVGVGSYTGPVDNYSCATRAATDPVYNGGDCTKTLWYKFTPTITGSVRYRIKANNAAQYDYRDIQLLRESVPGDSTTRGLQVQVYSAVSGTGGTWAQSCVSPGTYYLLLPGCSMLNEHVYPEIELVEATGDFCNRAVPAAISGAGAATASLLVNCHTIGTDYGEFAPTLTCPTGVSTSDYKTSWFRMDIGGTDTLDVTTFLVENTNASSADIKYRLMTGDCGAMQEQSCVLDALTQNTYQCLVPGQSYYVQVFTPVLKNNVLVTGTIDLRLSAVVHADTCAPLGNCLAAANFTSNFDCTKDDSVRFVNFSTYGTSIRYDWDFGFGNQTSNAVAPSFFYPALDVARDYTVKLVVTNLSCQKKDSVTKVITIPARPYVNLGPDQQQCNSNSAITLTAESHPGATYAWQDGSSAATLRIAATGRTTAWVRVSYNGCVRSDTINLLISPVAARSLQKIILCGDSIAVSVARGAGETYRWSTGATTSSIFLKAGSYWVDVTYLSCVYRDSFLVSEVSKARPLGNDTTACLSGTPFILRAGTTGALSYRWQNGSTADSFRVTQPGRYIVTTNFANCVVRDTVQVNSFPAPRIETSDTTICAGAMLRLPWDIIATTSGVYRDTLRYTGGCDSLIRRVNLTVSATVHLGRDTAVCLSARPLTLDASTPGATGYTWQDGSETAAYSVTKTGTYIVAVRIGNCITRDTIRVTNLANTIVLNSGTSICAGSSATLPSGEVVTTPGIYRDTVRTRDGCDSLVRTITVTILPKPTLANDSTVTSCTANGVNLNSLFGIATNTNYWSLGASPVQDPSAVVIPGMYRLITVNDDGCSDTLFATLQTGTNPALVVHSPDTICLTQTVDLRDPQITAGSGNNLSFTYFTDALATIPFVRYATAPPGTWYIRATTPAGCATIQPVRINAYPLPVLAAGPDKEICYSGATTLQAAVTNTSRPVTYQWEPVANGGISAPTAAITTVTPPGSLRYVVTVTDGYGCNYQVRDSVAVVMLPPVQANAGNDTTVTTGLPHQLQATGGTTYLWSPASLVSNRFIADPFVTIHRDSVLLFVEVSNPAGCKAYDSVWVRTLDGITYYVPNAFSPNNDGRNDLFRPIPVGIVRTESFRVLNRYGDVVYESRDIGRGWDGFFRGKAQAVGNYVWILKGTGRNGRVIEMSGNVLLLH